MNIQEGEYTVNVFQMYYFCVVAVKNHYIFSGLNNTNLLFYSSGGQRSKMGWHGCNPSGGSFAHLDENNPEGLWQQKPDGDSFCQQHKVRAEATSSMDHSGKRRTEVSTVVNLRMHSGNSSIKRLHFF